MNCKSIHIFLFTLCLTLVACKQKEVLFTYSPDEPRAGQSILFTNHTSEGENWEWNFGDGTTSTSKSPSKVYKRPGTYTVVLTVDKKASRRYSKTITVVDTIPTITLAEDSLVYFMTPVKLQMSAYNPYNYTKTYEWVLNDEVELLEGDLDDEYITVLFKKYGQDVKVACTLTIGDAEYECEQAFFVRDTLAPQLIMSAKGYALLYQRAFTYGTEEPGVYYYMAYNDPVSSKVFSMAVEGNNLYLFQSEQAEFGKLRVLDLASVSWADVMHNAVTGEGQGFYNGLCYDGMLYWTDATSGMIYNVSADVRNRAFTAGATSSQYWGDICHVGYSLTPGSNVSGLAVSNGYYMLGYGKGIYRFTAADRGATTTPEAGAILTDVEIKRFALDPLTRKIYYLTAQGLHVCNFNGDNPRLLCAEANGIALCVDNTSGYVYWTQNDGVYRLPLVQSPNNATSEMPSQFNSHGDVEAIVADPTPRYGIVK